MPDGMNHVQLDRLSDHDLLVRIAVQVECIPELERRIEANEREIVRLKAENRISTAIATLAASLVGVFVKP